MSAEKERRYVINAFPGYPWREKVRRMADDQVIAIYLRLKQNEQESKPETKPKDPDDQLRLF